MIPSPFPSFQFFSASGVPLAGGKLETYLAGTNTAVAVYTDASGSTEHPWPVVLDAGGRAAVWIEPSKAYKYILKTATDSLVGTWDGINSVNEEPFYNAEYFFTCDGVEDNTADFQALITAIASTLENGVVNNKAATLYCHSPLVINSTITVPAVSDFNIYLDCVVKVTDWELAATDPVFSLLNNNSNFSVTSLDCGKAAAGIVTNGFAMTIEDCRIFHFQTFGFKTTNTGGGGSSGNGEYSRILATQWVSGDTTEFADRATYFTADCFLIGGVDSNYTACKGGWARTGLKLGTGAGLNFFSNCHWWQGDPSGANKPTDPILIENYAVQKNYITESYLDNGITKSYRPNLVIKNSFYLNLAANVTMAHPYIRYNYYSSDIDVDNGRLHNTRASVGWESGDAGAWPDGADYTYINGRGSYEVGSGAVVDLYRTKFIISNNVSTTTGPVQHFMKPGGDMFFHYNIGATAEFKDFFLGTGERKIIAEGGLRVTSSEGTVPHELILGGGTTGMRENTANTLSFYAGNAEAWIVGADPGNLYPASDNTRQLGISGNRIKEIFCANGTINTSDKREKEAIRTLEESEERVAKKLKKLLRIYKFKDSVKEKGGKARKHCGVMAQDLKDAFESEGLVAEEYGILCYDEWEGTPEILRYDGTVAREATTAGSRYGIRYDELFAFILAATA
jgi:hypothetical protein